jgi:aryl-alcohol dehydrogenase-like predicted oxidoreductase
MHRPDPAVDIDETLGALTDLVQQGKIRYIGSSSFSAGQIVEAQWTARDHNLQRFRTEQPPYSLLVRGIELDVLPTAQRHGMGILTYSPLAGGWLSGSWTAERSPTSPARQRLAARFDMSLLESQLPAADVVLDPATLDRIDEIVRPGVNLNPADTSYGEQVLQPALRRRDG